MRVDPSTIPPAPPLPQERKRREVDMEALTKRELFAAMLMSECIKVAHDKHYRDAHPVPLSVMVDEAAQVAVKAADRLIAELAK